MIVDPNKNELVPDHSDHSDDPEIQELLENHVRYERRTRSTANLPRFYADNLTKPLKSRLTESLSQSTDDQLSVLEELGLMRESAGVGVQCFDDAYNRWAEDKGNRKLREDAMVAGTMMHDGLDKVVKASKTASDIRNNAKTMFGVSDLYDIVDQMVGIMHEVCGSDNKRIAQNFEARVENELSFIQQKTRITPDMTVLTMDESIPMSE